MKAPGDRLQDKAERLNTCAPPATEPPSPPSKRRTSRSLEIAQRGLFTGFDTINMLTATITDVLEENVSTNQANVVVNAIGKVLKVVELQYKYGKPQRRADGREERDLVLVGKGSAADASVEH